MSSFSRPISRVVAIPDDSTPLRRLGNVHWGPLVAAVLLSLIGLATVHSATSELQTTYLVKHALRLAVGLVGMAVAFGFDYRSRVNRAAAPYGLAMFLLVLVLFAGRVAGGARSWLTLGSTGIQPSEFAKLATALMLARYLTTIRRSHLEVREILLACAIAGLPMWLIALESDLGSAAMLMPLLAGMLLVTGVRARHLVVAVVLGLVIAGGLWSFALHDYQRQRVASFLSPASDPLGAGYQARQSKIAVGSGQLLGKGYGQGTQSQLRFLPERHTDFIMAVLAEEWGFAGVATVLLLYALYLSSAARIAMRGRGRTAVLLVAGLLAALATHVFYNTAMVVGLLPITGIPLPFLSYGGSFTLVNFISTGIILGVDFRRYVNR